MANNKRVDRARIDRWEAALADYLARQHKLPDTSIRTQDEPRINISACVRAVAGREHDGAFGPRVVAVTVARAEPTPNGHVVLPLAQFVALLRKGNAA